MLSTGEKIMRQEMFIFIKIILDIHIEEFSQLVLHVLSQSKIKYKLPSQEKNWASQI